MGTSAADDMVNESGEGTAGGKLLGRDREYPQVVAQTVLPRDYQQGALAAGVPLSQDDHLAGYKARSARLQTALDGDQRFAEMTAELQREADHQHDEAVRRLFRGDA